LCAPEKYYYEVRRQEPLDDIKKAARLIFLNKTCYNGLYRVNKKGKFNVPLGKYENPRICDKENLRRVSQVLNWANANILKADYQGQLKMQKKEISFILTPLTNLLALLQISQAILMLASQSKTRKHWGSYFEN